MGAVHHGVSGLLFRSGPLPPSGSKGTAGVMEAREQDPNPSEILSFWQYGYADVLGHFYRILLLHRRNRHRCDAAPRFSANEIQLDLFRRGGFLSLVLVDWKANRSL